MNIELFTSNSNSVSSSASVASEIWLKNLAFRISLQRPLDIANKLPIKSISYPLDSNDLHETKQELIEILSDLATIFDPEENYDCKNEELSSYWWPLIEKSIKNKKTKWKYVINNWQNRLRTQSNVNGLKAFNQTIWEQIELALGEESRVIQKSRIPLNQSQRLDVLANNTDFHETKRKIDNTNENTKRNRLEDLFDEEVYDDSSFFSMLLKSHMMSSSSEVSGMRKEDIIALQKYKSKKNLVDRKASKGRKIRYVVHPKLQNFMFPMKLSYQYDDLFDSRLMNSLFK